MSSKSVSNTLYNDGSNDSFSDFLPLSSQNPTINLFNNSDCSNDVIGQNQDTLKSNLNENQNENFSQEKQIENKSNSNAKNTKKEKKNYLSKKRNRSEEAEEKEKSEDETINNFEIKKVNKKIKEIISFHEKLDEKDDDIKTLEKEKKFIVIFLIIFKFNRTKQFHINKDKSIYNLTKKYHSKISLKKFGKSKKYFPNYKNIIEKIYNNEKKYPKSKRLLLSTPYQYINEVLESCKIYERGEEKKELRISPKSISKLIECLIFNLIRKEEKELKSKDNKIQSKGFIDIPVFNNNIQNRIEENMSIDYLNNNFDENININNINEDVLAAHNTKTKCTTNLEEIEKVNRKDNLFNVFKTMIKNEYKKNKKIKSDSIDEIIKDLYKKKNEKFNIENKDLLKLLNWIKKFLTKEINSEEKNEENIFKQDEEEQKKYYKNLKCKNEAVQILISLNLDGLIILQRLVTVEKKKYIKIKNSEEFERIIKEKVNPYFSLNLTYNEKNDISGRKNQLIKIAKKILTNLEECFKINEVAIELNLLNN